MSDVAEVWREYLGVEEDFGPQHDFFDVDGTSSTITTVAGRLGERLAGAGSRRPWSSGTHRRGGCPMGQAGSPFESPPPPTEDVRRRTLGSRRQRP
ncbi:MULTISPECIES: acyl carrier protein [Streptomyces]|uniref:acyl carrier protein n=1 Tax=Streptomyces TaxID=1883 RepID=UPI0033A02B61